jgi:signal transduction histidine kinase
VKPGSLRFRLLLAWAIFIVLLLQVASFGLRFLFERSITRRTQSELIADLRQIKRGMVIAPDGTVSVVRKPTDPQFDIVDGGRYWQVAEGGQILARSSSLKSEALTISKALPAGETTSSTWLRGPAHQHLFAVIEKSAVAPQNGTAQRTLTIMTAVDATEIRDDTDKFSSDLHLSLIALCGLLFAGAWGHVAIGLKPLERLRTSVAHVRTGLTKRVEGTFPDEIMPLVAETNELLDGQRAALQAARERAGDLAHGLKTPLAIMAAKSRQIRAQGEAEIASDIDNQIESMRRHIDRELARARAKGAQPSDYGQIDVSGLLDQLVSALQSLPRGKTLEWRCDIPNRILASVDGDDFNNMIGNLLENAEKWAAKTISISAGRVEAGVNFDIDDDGPGIAEADLSRVLRRGERADTYVSGSGLGLSIVNDLVELYGGKLTLMRSPLGGLKSSLFLPDRQGLQK